MLMTDQLLERFRQLGDQDCPNPVIPTRFYAPWQNCSWYPITYDEVKKCFFGVVQCVGTRLDYFSYADLLVKRSPDGDRIQRDPHWVEMPLHRLRMFLDLDI